MVHTSSTDRNLPTEILCPRFCGHYHRDLLRRRTVVALHRATHEVRCAGELLALAVPDRCHGAAGVEQMEVQSQERPTRGAQPGAQRRLPPDRPGGRGRPDTAAATTVGGRDPRPAVKIYRAGGHDAPGAMAGPRSRPGHAILVATRG